MKYFHKVINDIVGVPKKIIFFQLLLHYFQHQIIVEFIITKVQLLKFK